MTSIQLLTMISVALSQGAAQEPSQDRIDAIWAAADARMIQQLDGWFDDGEFPSCVELLKIRFDLDPQDYEVATDLGWMQENIERWPDAEATYKAFFAANPDHPDRALPLGQFFTMRKDYAKVVEFAAPYLHQDSHANLFRVVAHAYERVGRLKDSEATWKRYIAKMPDDGAAKVNLARVQKKIAEGG